IRLGFRPNLEKHILKIKIAEAPGRFKYQSVNTMLLGLVIKRTTGKHLAAYLEEKLWKPLGTESYATWNIVSKKRKMEIASSAINATARDFAKLGRLFLKKGKWNNTQIVDSAWINTIASIDTMNIYGDYKNQWWSRKI
ncbi:MAG: serine hydrolase, partial [Chitinophagales bacterium]|nr:serine hydrolase [Chitinophagales bacterium]